MTESAIEFTQNHFGIALPGRLRELHSKWLGTESYLDAGLAFLQASWNRLIGTAAQGEPVFLSQLFGTAIGNLIGGHVFQERETRVLRSLLAETRATQGGYLPVKPEYVSRFPNLGRAQNSPMVPEVYSSYYGYFLERVAGLDPGSSHEELSAWLASLQKPSGFIYNAVYSDTDERVRMESELSFQLFCALRLLKACDVSRLNQVSSSAKSSLLERWPTYKTIAGRYFAFRALSLISPRALRDIDNEEMASFLASRKDNVEGGFLDYRLLDKVDESMGSESAVELDKITSHVFSTFYAISISKGLGMPSPITPEETRKFVAASLNEDSGFGRQVLIKDFGSGFGPRSTELESTMILLLPALLYG
ncbi:MAG: hypothetical protein KGI38_05955 [Thaumarchaeota archaeon]|nr:hypothetical protein [Nitrososphaerota archaeon]